MDDEAPNWMDDTEEEAAPAEAAEAPALEGGEGGEGAAPPAEGEAPPPEDETPPPPRPRDPNRPIYFRVWTRPKHLQYSYLYDYRHNYYDDVINYLDRRSRGVTAAPEIPRPQTWAERALRTYTQKSRSTERSKDDELLTRIRQSNYNYHYHTREFFNRTHSSTYI
ncbi:flightin [Ischnura elegans]|uniref:flightin n=1 Tax=Ischnura elegans TaxID=197161 RepID=UPI001ED86BA3|nr:flightin [Ischnura elegans]XP_046401411.1 flightin [Ischnura elegans]XP_046401420.1 flightin [Ischnura elegans]